MLHAGSAADAVAIANADSVNRSYGATERITERVTKCDRFAGAAAERSADANAVAIGPSVVDAVTGADAFAKAPLM